MESLSVDSLRDGALVLVDTAPIIYMLEGHARFAAHFEPLFRRHETGDIVLAITTVSIAEVLTGPMKAGEEALARRLRAVLEGWMVVDFTGDIAESAARLRARHGLKLPDAIQLASALAINADALVTHARDFANVSGVRVLS
ncbi:MAG: PIN domain-containing protein [Proteobacteria bacterium]|nr:PIN domain-containing protein [Pseudomonadota bacterium]